MMTRWGDGMGEPPPPKQHGDEDLKCLHEAAEKAGIKLTVRKTSKV